ncbi:unnamed protein product [Auanema sp. JU1783]|nr:unnamed protein product [Auanema sp. JU1783]
MFWSSRCSSKHTLLKGLKVLELAGLAPVPHCGLLLADAGADVTVVEKKKSNDFVEQRLIRGKRLVQADLKSSADFKEIKDMICKSDILLDPYRPGVLEKIGLDPVKLLEENPKLIVCRLTGYGQSGPMKNEAGHDINYVGLSGLLPVISSHNTKQLWPPANLLADFAGGGLTAAFAVLVAALARSSNGGKGCIIDCSMVDGLAYLGTFINMFQDVDMFWKEQYAIFKGNYPTYRTYSTKDEKSVAVGALEPQFKQILFDSITSKLEKIFLQKTREEWTQTFKGKNACVTPVLDLSDCGTHEHNSSRGTFYSERDHWIPNFAPKFYSKEEFVELRKTL